MYIESKNFKSPAGPSAYVYAAKVSPPPHVTEVLLSKVTSFCEIVSLLA